ncbi:MAG: hypothetical protein HYX97_01995 [Chloroflexi bacterium]|nr:hypothetical protein [Chloroflexota bacterium]
MKRLVIFLLVGVLTFLSLAIVFYRGPYVSTARTPQVLDLTVPSFVSRAAAEAPVTPRRGVLLVDGVHANTVFESELSAFLNRFTARGFTVEWARSVGDDRSQTLAARLRGADAFLSVVPMAAFSPSEVQAVRDFVGRGGKVLLVADPTRPNNVNILSSAFGITVEDDYLYNTKEHDANFKNVIFRNFRSSPLTRGLRQVIFYTSSSLRAPSGGLVFGDQNTVSSMVERGPSPFAVAAEAAQGRVIVLSDLTFMTDPFNANADNGLFMSNLADYLTTSERTFVLADFPGLFRDAVDVVATQPALVTAASSMKEILSGSGRTVSIRTDEDPLRNTVILALWSNAGKVEQYLREHRVTVSGTVRTPFTADLNRTGTQLFALTSSAGRYVVLVMAENEVSLRDAVEQMRSGNFRRHLVSDSLSIISVPAPTPTPRLTPTPTPLPARKPTPAPPSPPPSPTAVPTPTPAPPPTQTPTPTPTPSGGR